MSRTKNALRSRVHSAPLLKQLGPGLITGAADDDPSGIATYSQAGAGYGFNMLWTMVLTYPLMAAVQSIAARIGRVTGSGLSANIRAIFPRWLLLGIVGLLFVANTINIGADLAAMGEAVAMVTRRESPFYVLGFGLLSLLLQFFLAYHRYVSILKWLTLVLFAYVGVVIVSHVDWLAAARAAVWPDLTFNAGSAGMIVAVFGTTISPYLFFWQSSQEVEEVNNDPKAQPLRKTPRAALLEFRRIRLDTYVGMGMSNLIAIAIMLATAATLNQSGHLSIDTAAQAAEALKPVAGDAAFLLFGLGIIGTGLLAVPVLAGSTAYAVAEAFGWKNGLEYKPWEAVGFYAIIGASMLFGVLLDVSSVDPIRALIWSAKVNGVISVPILAVMMIVAARSSLMGQFTATRLQLSLGWLTTAVMAAAAVAMFVFD
jgi:NRAMP (natural resistance-associated macrophage protein)-like metal ion transporter